MENAACCKIGKPSALHAQMFTLRRLRRPHLRPRRQIPRRPCRPCQRPHRRRRHRPKPETNEVCSLQVCRIMLRDTDECKRVPSKV